MGNANEANISLWRRLFEPSPWWYEHAECRGMPPDMFHPQRGASTRPGKEVCAHCPVRELCLEEHLDEPIGIWGGTTAQDRRRLRAERRRPQSAAARGHDVDPAQVAKELRAAADRSELEGRAALPAGPEQ